MTTVLDRLVALLTRAAAHNQNAEVQPVAVLWPDKHEQFASAIPRLQQELPVLRLGERRDDRIQGPAYWLRCVVAGTLDAEVPDGIPVIYLPGLGRADLRAVESCPREVAPIAELQYRGTWFAHPNGRDWSLRALLASPTHGLGLSLAEDRTTSELIVKALPKLLDEPLGRLEREYVDADYLFGLINPDPVARLLEWLSEPAGFQERMGDDAWSTFVKQAKKDYRLDPAADGPVSAARELGERSGPWANVWERFAASPERYAGIEERLRQAKPTDRLFSGPSDAWPQDNDEDEARLRTALLALRGATANKARDAVTDSWDSHKQRKAWVWARLDQSPLVFSLEQLQRLAEATKSGPKSTITDLVDAYAESGWQADDAFMSALASATSNEDREAVAAAATALYLPWVDSHARALQDAVSSGSGQGAYEAGGALAPEPGAATLFVDGLRLDLAHRLADRLSSLPVTIEPALAALPTVTPTAKPALMPVAEEALAPGKELGVARADSGVSASAAVLRKLLEDQGLQVLKGAETGDPSGTAWTEEGQIDGRGHQLQDRLVDDIDIELDRLAARIKLLIDAGWKSVNVVTDHGWLLLPGHLEKVDLPAATVELKKGRCARLKAGAKVAVSTVPWHWDPSVRIAVAPGVTCFEANQAYEHGGISLQECVVPRMRIRAGGAPTRTGGATITKVKWLGLMCRLEFDNVPPGAVLDIRALPAKSDTSVAAKVKETTAAGKQSLHVSDEDLEGENAFVVVVASDGSILAQREVTIGANR